MAKDKHELETMTKDELVDYAHGMDVEAQQSWLKEEIVSAILKGQRAAARHKQPSLNRSVDSGRNKPVKSGPINIKGVAYDVVMRSC